MYKKRVIQKSKIQGVPKEKGESIERKVERMVHNGEPITDGAPEIFTERKDGVLKGFDVRTDKWEVAASAMEIVHKNKEAKSQPAGNITEPKGTDENPASSEVNGN
jgi:uncharacterized protein (UPF0335 family)